MGPSRARGSLIGSARGTGDLTVATVAELRKELARRSHEAARRREAEAVDPPDPSDGLDSGPTPLAAGDALTRRVQ